MIVASVVKLAHDLGIRVIAEEIERQDQLEVLAELGCEYIQGFYFSRPMPIHDFRQRLVEESNV